MLTNGLRRESAHADDGGAVPYVHEESARAAVEEIAPDLKCASSLLANSVPFPQHSRSRPRATLVMITFVILGFYRPISWLMSSLLVNRGGDQKRVEVRSFRRVLI